MTDAERMPFALSLSKGTGRYRTLVHGSTSSPRTENCSSAIFMSSDIESWGRARIQNLDASSSPGRVGQRVKGLAKLGAEHTMAAAKSVDVFPSAATEATPQ